MVRGRKQATRGLPAMAISSVMNMLASKYQQGCNARWAGLAGRLTLALAKTAEIFMDEDQHVMTRARIAMQHMEDTAGSI